MTDRNEADASLTVHRRDGAVAIITLNRPGRLNALTAPMLASLRQHLDEAEADPDIRAILLTGQGKAFCAGQDLNDRDPRKIAWPPDLEAVQKEHFHPVVTRLASSRKPIVVAVNGVASGAGASLALAGDIVIAADTARFMFSFARVGLSVDAGGGWHLVKVLGVARARALLMTGAALSGQEAVEMGLIWRCVPEAQLHATAMAIAQSLADGPMVALDLIKQATSCAMHLSFEDYLVEEARLQGIAGASNDYREGVLSFLEKRSAKFTGR
jgi:2-(1,2-epoxy-1,2-dihydrophenyl)acetyl-CoA isomerase